MFNEKFFEIQSLKLNCNIIGTDEKILFYNHHGSISINGKGSYILSKWLIDNIKNFKNFKAGFETFSLSFKEKIVDLLIRLLEAKLIIFDNQGHNFINIVTSSYFKKKLVEYLFCYHKNPFEQYTLFINSKLLCIGQGNVFNTIANELSLWGFSQFEKRLVKNISFIGTEIDHQLSFLSDLESQFCLIIANQKKYFITIDFGAFIVNILNVNNLNDILLMFKLFKISRKDSSIENHCYDDMMSYHLINGFFCSIVEIDNKNISNLIMMDKKSFHVQSIKEPIVDINGLNYSALNFNLFRTDFIRMDIPILTHQNKLIRHLELINNQITRLVDEVTGPILILKEQENNQLPFSFYECSFLHKRKNIFCKRKINCIGISARECRNQVVLYALENYFFSLIKMGVPISIYGCGWNLYEAIFRALRSLIKNNINRPSILNSRKIDLCLSKCSSETILGYLWLNIRKYYTDKLNIIIHKANTAFYLCEISIKKKLFLKLGFL